MLTKVDVSNIVGTTVTFSLAGLSNGYLIKDIDGLDPVKANIVSSSFSTLDGEQYQSSRREARNVVFKIGLNLSQGSVKLLRNRLQGVMMPKTMVQMRFYDDTVGYVDISGMVESFECPLFTAEPEATISIHCFDPDFYEPLPVVIEGTTTFTPQETLVNYEGTVETGFRLRLAVDRILDEFTVYHRLPTGVTRSMDFASPLIPGDVLEISTVAGSKSAYLLRNGVSQSVLYGISPFAYWTEFFPGLNFIRIYSKGMKIPYTIDYTNKYGGL